MDEAAKCAELCALWLVLDTAALQEPPGGLWHGGRFVCLADLSDDDSDDDDSDGVGVGGPARARLPRRTVQALSSLECGAGEDASCHDVLRRERKQSRALACGLQRFPAIASSVVRRLAAASNRRAASI